MYDAHVQRWIRHRKAEEARALLAAVDRVRAEWRDKWAVVSARNEGRKWLT